MLTPVDQPLDKLDDLQKDEMYVGLLYNTLVSDICLFVFQWKYARLVQATKLYSWLIMDS